MKKMALKLQALKSRLYLLYIYSIATTWAAYIPHVDVSEHDHHVPVATSFMHFHGPVEGPEYEIKVPHAIDHNHDHNLVGYDGHSSHDDDHALEYTLDYTARPKYEFSYGVEDHHTGDFHGQKEVRDGSSVSGEYSVKEPGGSIRVVSYKADKDGFHAYVHTSDKNDHSRATYSSHVHTQTHHEDHHLQDDDDADSNYYSHQQYAR